MKKYLSLFIVLLVAISANSTLAEGPAKSYDLLTEQNKERVESQERNQIRTNEMGIKTDEI